MGKNSSEWKRSWSRQYTKRTPSPCCFLLLTILFIFYLPRPHVIGLEGSNIFFWQYGVSRVLTITSTNIWLIKVPGQWPPWFTWLQSEWAQSDTGWPLEHFIAGDLLLRQLWWGVKTGSLFMQQLWWRFRESCLWSNIALPDMWKQSVLLLQKKPPIWAMCKYP